jgi:hypothetical protein
VVLMGGATGGAVLQAEAEVLVVPLVLTTGDGAAAGGGNEPEVLTIGPPRGDVRCGINIAGPCDGAREPPPVADVAGAVEGPHAGETIGANVGEA